MENQWLDMPSLEEFLAPVEKDQSWLNADLEKENKKPSPEPVINPPKVTTKRKIKEVVQLTCPVPLCQKRNVSFPKMVGFQRHWQTLHVPMVTLFLCPLGKDACNATARIFDLQRHLQNHHHTSSVQAAELCRQELKTILRPNRNFVDPGSLTFPGQKPLAQLQTKEVPEEKKMRTSTIVPSGTTKVALPQINQSSVSLMSSSTTTVPSGTAMVPLPEKNQRSVSLVSSSLPTAGDIPSRSTSITECVPKGVSSSRLVTLTGEEELLCTSRDVLLQSIEEPEFQMKCWNDQVEEARRQVETVDRPSKPGPC